MELQAADAHTFDTIVGQDLVKRFLLRAAAQRRLPQALLFTGPEGVGKRSLAYALAKHMATAAMDPAGEEARKARGKVERGTHPDVIVVQPRSSSSSGQIVKEQIDEMHERAWFAPLESPNKIIVIAPVEAMNQVAANHMLKLLEEPPPTLHLLLCTQHVHQVLATIRSRCAVLRCPPVELEPLARWLTATAGCSERRAETAARLSGGRPGLAAQLVSGEDAERRKRVADELDFFHREGYPSIFRVGRNLLDATGGAGQAIAALVVWFRDLLVATLAAREGALDEALLINRDMADTVAAAVGRYSPTGLGRALDKILAPQSQAVQPFVDADLLMEVLLTDLGIALRAQ
jgi:DNA polymerase III delta' subunit